MASSLKISHVIQPAILCRDLDDTMDRLHAMFGIFPSERVDITNTGVNNAVYAMGGFTFLELIEPYDREAAAGRLLDRFGEGFHMFSCLVDAPSIEAVDEQLEAAGIRVVRRNKMGHILGAWHLHPKDTRGVLIALALRSDRDNSEWAGKAWPEYVETNSRILSKILGVSIACEDLEAVADVYRAMGFDFGSESTDSGDIIREAWTPVGTVLQLRTPTTESSIAARQLSHRGEGLCHLLLEAPDLDLVANAMQSQGAGLAADDAGGVRLWSDPVSTWGIPFEVRRSAM
jgi:hypothetical protein